ncbi:pentatricopeptide repeat-containing protein At3g26782, mitochondrial isoform X1 [Cryptomeria japonica]|uniref:pentatricopeptide repeat-containing protein At3g26782, mitochondrial isoform X1 n=2 Tax=Cryptomeria japonica TaxID=3369 RepID=UPI0025AD0921|nr:pentatricopeptide repeat-containing protein At3g26782, mitochondrial isoform X1 [Cryptomeria japonica]
MSTIAHLNQNIKTLCIQGHLKEAMHILLTAHDLPVHSSTYIHLLQACIENKALSEGKKVHIHINDRVTFATHSFLQNKLINMYDKCGSLVDARSVFDNMTEPNVFSWNMIISAYKRHGLPHQAFRLFYQMQRTAVKPDHFTLSTVLPVCGNVATLNHGFQIHGKTIRCGFQFHDIVMNTLIAMYAKCGRIEKARELFDRMPNANVVSWNAMITGYAQNGVLDELLRLFEDIPQKNVVSWTAVIAGCAQNGFVEKALEFFKQMQLAGIEADSSTFASILPACAKMGALERGMEIHQKIIERRFLPHVVVTTAIIDMYTKCGSIEKAHKLFDEMPQRNVVSWTAIITGYAQNGPVHKALELFNQMQLAGEKVNTSTFVSILPACAKMGALEHGMNVHGKIIESGLLSNDVVVTSLINMYAKCASISKAREIFDKMPQANVFTWTAMITGYAQNGFLDEALSLFNEMPDRNAVSWNAVIAGYAQNGQVEKAMEIFKQMQLTDVKPDKLTFASILPACSKIGALKQGMEFHQKIIEMGFLSDVVATSLIDMYAKCGSIKKARELFDRMKNPDVASWNAMISGYAMHGHSQDALKLFELMKYSQTKPNYISFVCILFACSHAGLVDDSCKYFNQMIHFYCIIPTIDHYVCMVDLLGRASCFEGALNFIIKMPIKPDSVVWMSLLGACRSHKNLHLGEFVATLLFELDYINTAPYVLLSNIYAEIGRWDDVRNVRKLMKDRGIKKIPGCSWIEVHKTVHVFCVGDRSHPQTQEIYAMLEKLSSELKEAGYAPDTKPVLNDVEDEEKELLLCHHSEKLAIAFGLLHMSAGTTIRVVKNLRVCGDCHTATKFISKIVAREIIVRDSNRFHHFKHGHCSCGDYW